jgi:hypothetical protein
MNAHRLLVPTAIAIALVLAFVLSGCMGGVVPPTPDPTVAVGARIAEFEEAIESYRLADGVEGPGLISLFVEGDGVLTISELGHSYSKSYETLIDELEDDEANQLYWRAEYGYALDLALGELVFSEVSATGVMAVQTFMVYERAGVMGIASRLTDSGLISWQWIKDVGVWRIASMAISFDPIPGAGYRTSGEAARQIGFGFGVGYDGL